MLNTIYCFSGTGNSLHVAQSLAKKIGAGVAPMHNLGETTHADVVGFVFPTYFWWPPHRVEEFIGGLEIANPNAYLFAAITCGGASYGVSGVIDRLLGKKGRKLDYARNIKSVENYLPGYRPNDKPAIHQKVEEKIQRIAADITRKTRKRAQPVLPVNSLIHRFLPREDGACDAKFTVSAACNACGLCTQVCPVRNISLEEGIPAFRHRCEHCMACVNLCPAKALDWDGKTSGKARYHNPNVSGKGLSNFWALADERVYAYKGLAANAKSSGP